jgi:Asp-tRNA(Asn)/Glu-tRNA(Gln) amidotransferase B subunit
MEKNAEKDLEKIVGEVIAANASELLAYRGGDRTAINRLVVEVCKRSGGRVDPAKARRAIISKM